MSSGQEAIVSGRDPDGLSVEWLVEEADMLLDASDVGLYEFWWMQRGRNADADEDGMRRVATEALRRCPVTAHDRQALVVVVAAVSAC